MPAPARSSPPSGQQGEQPALPEADARLARRLAVAALAAAGVAVPVGVLLFVVRSGWAPARALDESTADRLHQAALDSPALAETLRVVSVVTHPWVVRCVACAAAVVAWRRGRRRLAAWVLVTVATGGVLGGLLKLLVHRARPVLPEPVASAGGYSFPSGHALNSMLLAATLVVLATPALRGRRRAGVWLAALGFVLLVGFDRVALGVHYVSDVLAGWFVALAVVTFMVLAFAEWRREEHLPPSSPARGLDPSRGAPHPGARP
jgi:undecaprenyl-diphosphatase